jgi:hypothetical protein
LKKDFDMVRATFEKIKSSSIKAFEKELAKNKTVQVPALISFEEFLKLEK